MTSHIFLLDTELQCFASLKVIEYEEIKNPVLFSFNSNVFNYLQGNGHQATRLAKKGKGLFRQARALHDCINQIKKHLSDKNIIYVHRLDLIYTNVVIATLLQHYDIEVRIVTEGTLNYALEDASANWKRRSQRWAARILFGATGLRKLEILGERVGIDLPLVTRAYCFAGLESPYPAEKVKYLSFFHSSEEPEKEKNKKALVVGQRILDNKKVPKALERKISNQILSILREEGVDQIEYIGHPRDQHSCLLEDNYKVVNHDSICLEQYMEQNNYDILVSCSSTVLFTAKLIFGDKVQSISVGANIFPSSIQNVSETMEKVGVKLISL